MMELVLLGTGGGPRPSETRFPSSQAVVLDSGRILVVDCGNGVARQMAAAGLLVESLSELLLTHHHVDHSADLGYLPIVAWVQGRREAVEVYGPPPTVGALEAILAGYAEDIEKRTQSTGRPPFGANGHDVSEPGTVFEDDEVKVTAAFVDHPPFEIALAYRIDARGRSVVVSGDTAPSGNLVELAHGADILVHEVVHPSGLVGLQESTNASTIESHMRRNHTMVDDIGKIATEAGVATLVLSHLIPHRLADDEWLAAVGEGFTGRVVVGQDLMRMSV